MKTSILPTASDTRVPIASIMTVSQPLEAYRAFVGAGEFGQISSFDSYIVYQLLDLYPGTVNLLHRVVEPCAGESLLLALQHPNVARIHAIDLSSVTYDNICRYVANSTSDKLHQSERLIVSNGFQDYRPGKQPVIVWLHLQNAQSGLLMEELAAIVEKLPEAVILITGLGLVGECPGIQQLLQGYGSSDTHRLSLAREWADLFRRSTLGVIAPADHEGLALAVRRLEQLHTGNLDYLRLLRIAHESALHSRRTEQFKSKEPRGLLDPHHKARDRSFQALQSTLEANGTTITDYVNSRALRLGLRLDRLLTRFLPAHTLRFRICKLGFKASRKFVWRPLRNAVHVSKRVIQGKPR